MRIRVTDNDIMVSGPASLSTKKLQRFVEDKTDWVHKTWTKQQKRKEVLDEKRKAHEGTLLLRGERKPVHDFPVPGLKKPMLVEHPQAIVYQYNPADSTGSVNPADRPPLPDPDLIHTFYRRLASRELKERVAFWVRQLPFQPSNVSIRNQKTKWGSCSARGTISLNWRLVKCPPSICDYIIIHELCHLRHFNHSRAFWQTVACYYPAVEDAKSWIRKKSDEIFADI